MLLLKIKDLKNFNKINKNFNFNFEICTKDEEYWIANRMA